MVFSKNVVPDVSLIALSASSFCANSIKAYPWAGQSCGLVYAIRGLKPFVLLRSVWERRPTEAWTKRTVGSITHHHVTCTPVQGHAQVLYISVLAIQILQVLLGSFLIQSRDNDDPPFDGCIDGQGMFEVEDTSGTVVAMVAMVGVGERVCIVGLMKEDMVSYGTPRRKRLLAYIWQPSLQPCRSLFCL